MKYRKHSVEALANPAFISWRGMLNRCKSKHGRNFQTYGAKGVSVCERWHSFENFLADMGTPKVGETLDRINNNGNYEPSNCRWADKKTQARNRSFARMLTLGDRTMHITDWAAELGVGVSTIVMRLDYYKWPIERALTKKTYAY